jgi:hypothetical protein
MLLTSTRYEELIGVEAPGDFAEIEARVVRRLEGLLARTLVLDEELVEGDAGYGEGYTSSMVPAGLAEAIAWGVRTLSAPMAPAVPAGVSSVNIAGEYATVMAFGYTTSSDGTALPVKYSAFADLGGRCVTLALRYRRVAL